MVTLDAPKLLVLPNQTKLTLTVTLNPNRHSNGNMFYAHFVDIHKKVVSQ